MNVLSVALLLNGSDVLPLLFNESCTTNDFCYFWLAGTNISSLGIHNGVKTGI
jgi:hypothetical protein